VKHVKSNAITVAGGVGIGAPGRRSVCTLQRTWCSAAGQEAGSWLNPGLALCHFPATQDGKLLGMGSGQPNRVKSVQIALEKAKEEVKVRFLLLGAPLLGVCFCA